MRLKPLIALYRLIGRRSFFSQTPLPITARPTLTPSTLPPARPVGAGVAPPALSCALNYRPDRAPVPEAGRPAAGGRRRGYMQGGGGGGGRGGGRRGGRGGGGGHGAAR